MSNGINEGILKPFTEVFDRAWEYYLYDPCTDLPTLFEPDNIDAKWIRLLAPLVGFTPDLSMNPSVAELRRILKVAVEYWNDKPTEKACINDAIRMVTGNRFRAANYFDFRMETDWTVLGEELEDFDPHAITFWSEVVSGSSMEPVDGIDHPYGRVFTINDLPGQGLFRSRNEYRWLSIVTMPAAPQNVGIYEIEQLLPGTKLGYIVDAFPAPVGVAGTWQLFGGNQEHVTEARIVDPGAGTLAYDGQTGNFTVGQKITGQTSGATAIITADADAGAAGVLTLRSINGRFQDNEQIVDPVTGDAYAKGELQGVLNRELLRFLMGGNDNTVRPMGERIDVVYINFLDQFNTQGDLTQWTQLPDDDGITVAEGTGYAQFTASYELLDADSQSQYWTDQCTAWKIIADTTSTIVDLMFWATDEDNHYFVRVDYSAKTVRAYKKVATVDTAIGSAVSILGLIPDYSDVIRVDVVTNGSDTDIRVKVNGELEIDETDSPSAFTAGKVGARAQASTFKLELVEVNVLPAELERVGPNP